MLLLLLLRLIGSQAFMLIILILQQQQQQHLVNAADAIKATAVSKKPQILTMTPARTTTTTIAPATAPLNPYCTPALCELYNGTDFIQVPHIACANNATKFGQNCGSRPHLLYMSERRRNFILDMHNLARERIASGQLEGYKAAARMPVLKWDPELAYLAELHVRRCRFAHDKCRNTPTYPFSGQNIGYFWIGREFYSHSRRMKSFVINWFREYRDANQTFIDSYHPHPEGKKIGHFTLLVADRVHRVGCAAVRYRDNIDDDDGDDSGNNVAGTEGKHEFLMTCNYDYNNIFGEPVYQTGKPASKCALKANEKYLSLCDWHDAIYDYESAESIEDANQLDNNIPI